MNNMESPNLAFQRKLQRIRKETQVGLNQLSPRDLETDIINLHISLLDLIDLLNEIEVK